jgi:glutathione S-transferase
LHLTDQYPEANLAPRMGDALRPVYYQWLTYLTNTLQSELITYFYPERMADDAAMAARVKVHAERRVGGMLDLLDTHLGAKGPLMLGADCSAVDLYLFMLCRWTRAHAAPAQTRPNLARLMQYVAARPAVQRVFAREQLPLPWF